MTKEDDPKSFWPTTRRPIQLSNYLESSTQFNDGDVPVPAAQPIKLQPRVTKSFDKPSGGTGTSKRQPPAFRMFTQTPVNITVPPNPMNPVFGQTPFDEKVAAIRRSKPVFVPTQYNETHPDILALFDEIPNHSIPAELRPKNEPFQQYKPVKLSEEQERIKDIIVKGDRSVFFTGKAGTGKSFLLQEIIKTLVSIYGRDKVAVTASTGIAAYNIQGITLHSFAGVGLAQGNVNELVKFASRSKKTVRRWTDCRYLIVDEISMIDAEFFDKLNFLGKRLRYSQAPFGGIKLVLCGDFLQLPPPSKDARFVFESNSWRELNLLVLELKTVFRQQDPVFVNILNELRVGRVSQESAQILQALDREPNADVEPTNLFPLRREVDSLNQHKLSQLPGPKFVFKAYDWAETQNHLSKLDLTLMAPRELELRVGAQVMVIKNLKDDLLFNGCVGTVCELEQQQDNCTVEFKLDGLTRKIRISRESFDIVDSDKKTIASRKQLPLILSYAMSIHKSQGQTLKCVNIDLKTVFEKGQAYVALSRCTSLEGLRVRNFNPESVKVHPKVVEFCAMHNLS